MLETFNNLIKVFVDIGFNQSQSELISCFLIACSLVLLIWFIVYLPYAITMLIDLIIPKKYYLLWDTEQCYYIHYGLYSKYTKKRVERKYKTCIVRVEEYPNKDLMYSSLSACGSGFFNSLQTKLIYIDKSFGGDNYEEEKIE